LLSGTSRGKKKREGIREGSYSYTLPSQKKREPKLTLHSLHYTLQARQEKKEEKGGGGRYKRREIKGKGSHF